MVFMPQKKEQLDFHILLLGFTWSREDDIFMLLNEGYDTLSYSQMFLDFIRKSKTNLDNDVFN